MLSNWPRSSTNKLPLMILNPAGHNCRKMHFPAEKCPSYRKLHFPAENAVRKLRKILVSVKFLSAILGPEMAAPFLWAPRISVFFLQENLHVHKIPRFGGGVFWFGGGRFYFYGRWDFSEELQEIAGGLQTSRIKTFISCYRTQGPWNGFSCPGKPNASSISTPS